MRILAGIAALLVGLLTACVPTAQEDANRILTYTAVQGDQTATILETFGYESQFPGGRIRPLPVPTAVLNFEPYVLSLSTGSDAIDIYLLDAPWVKRYSATSWLAPIEIDEKDVDLSAFRRELLDVTSIGAGDERAVLAIPFETKGNILFYRRDLLEKAGFSPPENWDQLFEQCHRILAGAGEGGPRYGLVFHGSVFINDFYPVMWGFGGGAIAEDGSLTIDRPENVRALAMIKRALGTISPSAEEMDELGLFSDYLAVDRLFASGQAIFMINWNIRWGDLKRGIAGQSIDIAQVGVAPIPHDGDHPHYSNIGSFGWGINAVSPRRPEARRFISLITSYEAQRWRAINGGIVPARLDVLADPEVIRRAPEVLAQAKVFERVSLRARPFQREINDGLNEALVIALRENLDPREVLIEAHRRIADELAWTSRTRQEGKRER